MYKRNIKGEKKKKSIIERSFNNNTVLISSLFSEGPRSKYYPKVGNQVLRIW